MCRCVCVCVCVCVVVYVCERVVGVSAICICMFASISMYRMKV